ncbi:MAG: hypothetical protein M5U34_07805 [Chloroflexi bacterium]|nr:hypothetical protein [Chloroflexota bacterium]
MQRAQVNEFVARVYYELLADYPDLWLSAAVWPVHTVKPEWGWQRKFMSPAMTHITRIQRSGWLRAASTVSRP